MKNSNDLPIEWVTRIFMRLHGRFGNTFFDKFRIGELSVTGQDIGIENAKLVWSEELAGISAERIKNALETSFDYPPSCDEFKAACRSTPSAHQDFARLPKPVITEEEFLKNKKKLDQITSQLKPKTDYRAWAKSIISDFEKGLKVNDYSLKCAREALSMEIYYEN